MDEQRKHLRYSVVGTGINAKTVFNTEVELIDISTSGVSVSCTRRLNMGAEYLFKFEHGDKVISVKGDVVWARLTGVKKVTEGESVPVYTAGIKFKYLTEDAMESLGEFVAEKIGQVRERRLSGVRIRIHEAEKAVLTYSGISAVNDMSLGGVRIGMDQPPPEGTMLLLELIFSENETPILCEGRVTFSHETLNRSPWRHNVGIEFTGMSEADKSRLERFINSLPPNI